MPTFIGKGNPELILVTRWVCTLTAGPNFDCMKSALEQQYAKEHYQYYHVMLERDQILIAGPYAYLGAELIIFADRVSNLEEANAIINQDPSVKAGIWNAHCEEWFSNALQGGRWQFFPEDTVPVRQAGQLFVETGYGVLASDVGSTVVGEVAEQIGDLFGPKVGQVAEKIGEKVGGAVGEALGEKAGEVVTDIQGADKQPTDPKPDPPVQHVPEEDLPDGAPLPYFGSRWVALLDAGPNYNGQVLTPSQPTVDQHIDLMERYVLEGKMLLAGPVTTFYTAWLIYNNNKVTTYDYAKQLTDADPALKSNVLSGQVVEWFTNIRKGESSGIFSADPPQVKETAQALIKAGFFPIREGDSLG